MEQDFGKKLKTCAITGRRPNGFPWEYGDNEETRKYKKQLLLALSYLVKSQGVEHFITGGAQGVDLDVAEHILSLCETYPFLRHTIVLPYKNQGGRYGIIDKKRHDQIQKNSQVVTLSEQYTPWCMHTRNEYMVNQADVVAAFFSGEKKGGTYNTVRYAKKKNKPVFLFNLDTCQTTTGEQWINAASAHSNEQLKLI